MVTLTPPSGNIPSLISRIWRKLFYLLCSLFFRKILKQKPWSFKVCQSSDGFWSDPMDNGIIHQIHLHTTLPNPHLHKFSEDVLYIPRIPIYYIKKNVQYSVKPTKSYHILSTDSNRESTSGVTTARLGRSPRMQQCFSLTLITAKSWANTHFCPGETCTKLKVGS